jgi:pilus assembly protein CpaF
MVLAAAQVITRKEGGGWVPTSVRFRDPLHQRSYLRRLAETNPPLFADGGPADAAFDVKLANGFRAVGILPPDVLEQPPLAVFTRGQPTPTQATPVPQATTSGTVSAAAVTRPTPPESSVVNLNALSRGPAASGRMPRPDVPGPVQEPPVSEFYLPAHLDPKEKVRRRVSERIIRKCAAAGVYDLSAIPAAELQRVILAHVQELNAAERMNLSDHEVQIVALEIFTGMRR